MQEEGSRQDGRESVSREEVGAELVPNEFGEHGEEKVWWLRRFRDR